MNTTRPDRVILITGSIGAGHIAASRVLRDELNAKGIPTEVIDFLDLLQQPLAFILRNGYRWAATLAPLILEKVFQGAQIQGSWVDRGISVISSSGSRKLKTILERADVVVSTFPLATQAIGALKLSGKIKATTVTYLTDPAPNRVWFHQGIDSYLCCTEATAKSSWDRFLVRVFPAGPLVPASFREKYSSEQLGLLRQSFGIEQGKVMALVMCGSDGIGEVIPAACSLKESRDVVPVVLCGNNLKLQSRLAKSGVIALGWRDDVGALMGASDVLLHNAGGMCFSESLVTGLPSVIFHPVAGHGRQNAQVLETSGLSIWARSRDQLVDCVIDAAKRERFIFPIEQELAAICVAQLCKPLRIDHSDPRSVRKQSSSGNTANN
jgi:processive 1,2-diacylglycerol beta-glucosyltransferase